MKVSDMNSFLNSLRKKPGRAKAVARVFLKGALSFITLLFAFSAHELKAQSEWLSLGSDSSQERYTIKFNDVDATEFINFVTRISGKNFIYDSNQIQFKITMVSEESATSSEILSMLLQIMTMNGFTVTEEGNNILLYQSERPFNSLGKVVTESGGSFRGLVTRVFRLRYASVRNMKDIVTKLATDSSRVAIHEPTRQIIVCDTVGNVERMAELMLALDQLDSVQEIEIYKVRHANIAALKSFAEQVMAPFTSSFSPSPSNSPSTASGQTGAVAIIPNTNTSSLFIIGTRQLIDRTLSVLASLDTPSELSQIAAAHESKNVRDSNLTDPSKILDVQINPEFYIYKLQYRAGDQIHATLRSIASAKVNSSLEPALIQSLESIQWLENTNSLLFTGDSATLVKIKNLIQGLDTPVKQVFIEALIIDTTVDNSNTFGVELGGNFTWGPQRLGVSLGNFRSDGSSSLGSDVSANHAVKGYNAPTLNGSNFSAGVIGSVITRNGQSFSTIGALVTAVQSDKNTRIVLNPKILTEDNVACDFFVGQQVRIKSGLVQNSGNNNVTSSNFELADVGTTLKITPTISTDDLVTLQIEQITSSPLDASNANDQSALVSLTTKSRTSTRLHVPDRHFVILAGMIDDYNSHTDARVPLLGSIPVLGFLFRSDNKTVKRRNLLFFIRPHIVASPEESRLLTERYKLDVQQSKAMPADLLKQTRLMKLRDDNSFEPKEGVKKKAA